MALSVDLARVPWSFVMASFSLTLIYILFRRRPDIFTELALSGKEIALLALGSVAGWASHIPLAVFGGTYLTVNVGGTVVPIILIGIWIRHKKLRLIPAAIGTAIVTFTAWKIVEFRPDTGIVARYPTFFLPVIAALGFALLVSIRRPVTGAPIAYTAGTLGALIGADLMHVADIRAHFRTSTENTVISIGGAGVFDMVFLAGTFAMALHLGIVALIQRRVITPPTHRRYPAVALTLRDSQRVAASFRRLETPNPLDRAIQGVAMSNLALREGDYTRSVRMSWLAVDSILKNTPATSLPDDALADIALLERQYTAASTTTPTLEAAGNANLAAKHLIAHLAPGTGMRHHLEGIA